MKTNAQARLDEFRDKVLAARADLVANKVPDAVAKLSEARELLGDLIDFLQFYDEEKAAGRTT